MSTILQMSLSFSKTLTSTTTPLFLHTKLSHLSLHHTPPPTPKHTTIRMGGGPRTFPGGVSKWQWKRMQAKKAKQLLKARLCRERQIYEMRKRAELKAAVSELERPWEVVERAPNLFSVSTDEQLKVLADRFQKPGGFDLWTEKDGPQLFETPDGVPSGRFFPKGVVHSVKPYGTIAAGSTESSDSVAENSVETGRRRSRKWRKKGNRKHGGTVSSDRGIENMANLSGEVYDMSLQQGGIYGFQEKNGRVEPNSGVKEPVFEELDWREMIE